MEKTSTMEIKCESCNFWFPSPIFTGDAETFDSTTMEGNTVQCPICRKTVNCNKENMRVKFDKGGFLGNKT